MRDPRELKLGHERVFLLLSDVHDGLPTRSRNGELESMHVQLALPHLRADSHVWLSDPAVQESLSGFFDGLAENWRGWDGV